MPGDEPKDVGDDFDVVMLHSPTDDGEGAKVLRARPGRLDAGEVRPLQDGKPLHAGGEVVRLEPRAEGKPVYDVKVQHVVPETRASTKPVQVATRQYRDSWDRTFGAKKDAPN